MTNATRRTIARWLHILAGLPLLGYIYGPPEEVAPYAYMFKFVFMPIILLTGLWMWKGHTIRKLFIGERAE
ncbi:MAG: hypothetical protein QM770_06830 [Tepidisphaeraceae bacterium]